MAVLLLTSVPLAPKIGFTTAYWILLFGEIIAFVPIFFGVRSYRQTIGAGAITFWKAFNIGILIVVISCVFYAVSWNIVYYWIAPDFPTQYSQYVTEQMKLHGALPKEIADAQKQLEESRKMLANPFINLAIAFTDPLETGIIVALLCAALLRKKPLDTNPPIELTELN